MSRLPWTVRDGVAKSPLGPVRQRETDEPQIAEAQRKLPAAKPEKRPCPLKHRDTHVPGASQPSEIWLALLATFENAPPSFQSELMVIFDFFRRTNNNTLPTCYLRYRFTVMGFGAHGDLSYLIRRQAILI